MNQFGQNFRLSIFGRSHSQFVGITIDGVPAGIPLCAEDFSKDLDRRKSGKIGTTPRVEADEPQIVCGTHNGFTSGDPLTILFANNNTKSKDYSNLVHHPRPSHADFVASKKFNGFNDPSGGGHFSGRLTLCLVSAGVVAKKIAKNIKFKSKIVSIGGYTEPAEIEKAIADAQQSHDSLGGTVETTINGVPVGLGEPFFGSLESNIAHLAFSIPALKSIEFGAGSQVSQSKGSDNNDKIVGEDGKTLSNNDGGIVGGISNGNPIVFRCHFKPTPSIGQPQNTFNFEKKQVEPLQIVGRHDACLTLRAAVVVESVAAIAIAEAILFANSTSQKA